MECLRPGVWRLSFQYSRGPPVDFGPRAQEAFDVVVYRPRPYIAAARLL